MSNGEPMYHTLQHLDVDEDADEPGVGYDDLEDDYGIEGDVTTRNRPSNGYSPGGDLPTRIVENPPPYEPAQQDNLLNTTPAYDGSFPMASMSRDAYDMDDDNAFDDDDDDDEMNPPECGWWKFKPRCMRVRLIIKVRGGIGGGGTRGSDGVQTTIIRLTVISGH